MKQQRWFLWGTIMALGLFGAILFGAVLPGRAQQPENKGPRIAGMFAVQQVTDLGAEQRVKLRLRVINAGDVDLSDARLTVRTLGSRQEALAAGVLRAHRDAMFTQEIVVPKAELEGLQGSNKLVLTVEFRDEQGKEVAHTIELRHMAALGREE